jgi:hypothetical protein
MGSRDINEVVVTDIKISFSTMVVFMVKWAIATIPAIIILTAVGSITLGVLRAIFGAIYQRMMPQSLTCINKWTLMKTAIKKAEPFYALPIESR